MPKRRYVSENAIFSKAINKISVGAEATFYRLLSISDDYGVLPDDNEELIGMINYRGSREKDFSEYLLELINSCLLVRFEFGEKHFLMFNPESFDKYQSHIKNKRAGSEYTGIKAKTREIFDLERKSMKIVENPRNVSVTGSPKVYSIKHKAIKDSSSLVLSSSFSEPEEIPESEFLTAAEIIPDSQVEYFKAKELFREFLYPEKTVLPNIGNRQFAEVHPKYSLQRIETDIKTCQDEGWKSFASLKQRLENKLKTKAEKFSEQGGNNGNGNQSDFSKRLNADEQQIERSAKAFGDKIRERFTDLSE